jgi:hypothetical protein
LYPTSLLSRNEASPSYYAIRWLGSSKKKNTIQQNDEDIPYVTRRGISERLRDAELAQHIKNEEDGVDDEVDYWLEFDDDGLQHEEIEEAALAPIKKQLPFYKTDRPIKVVRKPTQLSETIAELLQGGNTTTLGMDVEYATLETNIAGNLPAMLQLASETLIVLIWLDKFPDHGRDVVFSENQENYKPLLDLLASTEVEKLTVGGRGDTINLAKWWGILLSEKISSQDEDLLIDQYFGNIVNLVDAYPWQSWGINKTEQLSLGNLCAFALEREMPKKYKKKRMKKLSHWRAKELTEEMRAYAACDARCLLDIRKAMESKKETLEQQ